MINNIQGMTQTNNQCEVEILPELGVFEETLLLTLENKSIDVKSEKLDLKESIISKTDLVDEKNLEQVNNPCIPIDIIQFSKHQLSEANMISTARNKDESNFAIENHFTKGTESMQPIEIVLPNNMNISSEINKLTKTVDITERIETTKVVKPIGQKRVINEIEPMKVDLEPKVNKSTTIVEIPIASKLNLGNISTEVGKQMIEKHISKKLPETPEINVFGKTNILTSHKSLQNNETIASNGCNVNIDNISRKIDYIAPQNISDEVSSRDYYKQSNQLIDTGNYQLIDNEKGININRDIKQYNITKSSIEGNSKSNAKDNVNITDSSITNTLYPTANTDYEDVKRDFVFDMSRDMISKVENDLDSSSSLVSNLVESTDNSKIIPNKDMDDLNKVTLPKNNIHNITNKIITKIDTMTNNEKSVIKVKLEPEELGKVDIVLEIKEGKILGKIIVDNTSIKHLFQERIGEISSNIKQHDIDLTKLDVDVNSNSNFTGNMNYNQQNNQNQKTNNLYSQIINDIDVENSSIIENPNKEDIKGINVLA